MDPYPPERLIELAVALLPALSGAVLAAASATIASMSGARRAALIERLEGAGRHALQRYNDHQAAVELRWMVLRAGGIALTALLLNSAMPSDWAPAIQKLAATSVSLLAFALPAHTLRAIFVPRADVVAPWILRVLRPVEFLALPVSAPIRLIGNLIARQAPDAEPTPDTSVTEAEVEMLVTEGEQDGSLAHDQSQMIRNVLEFRSITAGEVMVPRTQVTAFDIELPIEELLKQIAETQHSRYPIYRNSIDSVFGVLHSKDLLNQSIKQNAADLKLLNLRDIVRTPISFVPEGQLASSVLRDMRAQGHHMAVVIDEFGGTSGIVTLEDILEQIVGDIRDEHDSEEPPIVDLGDGRLMVDASISIQELSRYLGVEFPADGDYNSLGGFLVAAFGRVPRVGAKTDANSMEFLVREADERKISQVEIVRPKAMMLSRPPSSKPSRMTAA
ncbi:MAG: hemolysin family protein [Polyangiaceae bacterium]|nr:hemolysin family protein [Polyangiaceae bacterium]